MVAMEAADGAPRADGPLDVSEAARIARRSVRTIRRAYLSGRLRAHRDGNGRGVTIRYADLQDWLFAEEIVPTSQPTAEPGVRREIALMLAARPAAAASNLELLSVARQRRGRGARASVAAPRAEGRPGPPPA